MRIKTALAEHVLFPKRRAYLDDLRKRHTGRHEYAYFCRFDSVSLLLRIRQITVVEDIEIEGPTSTSIFEWAHCDPRSIRHPQCDMSRALQ